MEEKIQLTQELQTLLEKCKQSKDITRNELISLWNNKFQPNCQKLLDQIVAERKLYHDLSDGQFFKKIICEFLASFIPQVCAEYGTFLSEEKLQKYKGLLNPENIILINDPNYDHDFSSNSEKGQIIINEAKFAKKDEQYLEKAIVRTLGSLPHETFHIIINMLNPHDKIRMIYQLNNGEIVHFPPGKYGQIISEGFVEKYSSEFCEKHGIFYTIDPSYVPFVNLCSYIQSVSHSLDDNCIFNSNYEAILSNLSDEALIMYEETERLTMLNHFQVKEYEGQKDFNGKKIMINPNDVTLSYTEKIILKTDLTK